MLILKSLYYRCFCYVAFVLCTFCLGNKDLSRNTLISPEKTQSEQDIETSVTTTFLAQEIDDENGTIIPLLRCLRVPART